MNGRPVTPEEPVAIAHEYVGGLSIERLACKYHRSPQFVRQAILSQGLRTRRPGRGGQRKVNEEQQLVIMNEYRDGATIEMLGDKYGCSPGTVRNVLSDHGVEMRRTGRSVGSSTGGCVDVDSPYRRKARARFRALRFGWAPEQFDQAWEKQRGRCAVCETPMKPHGRYNDSVAVDHDHVTGRARSLVCQMCNKGLGQFKDSPSLLRKAAGYLEAHQSPMEKGG